MPCSGARILLNSLNMDVVEHSLQFGFQASNNEVEYEALITCLRLTWNFETTLLKITSYSSMVVNQVNSSYVAKGLTMEIYLKKVKELMQNFEKV